MSDGLTDELGRHEKEAKLECERNFERIQDLEGNIAGIKRRILEAGGWEHTCQTPGCIWLWKRGNYTVNESTALDMCESEIIDFLAGG